MLEKLKIFKKKPEPFRMRVSFDLDEVLFVSQRTHKVEPALPFPLNKIYIERLRFGTPRLINTLQKMGFDVWVYTSSFRTQKYIRNLFRFYGVKFKGIVNGQRHLKEVQGQRREILPQKVPPRYNISLHVDNETVICSYGSQMGFEAYQLDAPDDDWVEKVIAKAEAVKRKGAVLEVIKGFKKGQPFLC